MDHGSGRSVAGGVLNEAGRDRLEEAYRSYEITKDFGRGSLAQILNAIPKQLEGAE